MSKGKRNKRNNSNLTTVNQSALNKKESNQLPAVTPIPKNEQGQIEVANIETSDIQKIEKLLIDNGINMTDGLKEVIRDNIVSYGSAFFVNRIQEALNDGLKEGLGILKVIQAALIAQVQETVNNFKTACVTNQVVPTTIEEEDIAWLTGNVDAFALMGGSEVNYGLGGNTYEATSKVVEDDDEDQIDEGNF